MKLKPGIALYRKLGENRTNYMVDRINRRAKKINLNTMEFMELSRKETEELLNTIHHKYELLVQISEG